MRTLFSLLIIVIFIFSSCTERLNDPPDSVYDITTQVAPVGSRQTFELATWNIEHFPKSGETTLKYVSAIIKQLDLDLIAVEEISDSSALHSMLNDLPGWQAVLSSDRYRTAAIKKQGFYINLPLSALVMPIIFLKMILTLSPVPR